MAVAAAFGVSQHRVSEIGQKVRAWVDCLVPPRHFADQPGMRLHLAIANERIRLKDAYEPLVGMFTGCDGEPRYVRRYITVVNGEALNTVEVSEKPNFRLLNQAVDVQGRLAQLEAIAHLGPFADLPNQVHQTILHRVVGQASGLPDSTPSETDENGASAASNANASPSRSGESLSNSPPSANIGANTWPSSAKVSPSNANENRGGGVLA
jgi:hypothetical protein